MHFSHIVTASIELMIGHAKRILCVNCDGPYPETKATFNLPIEFLENSIFARFGHLHCL